MLKRILDSPWLYFGLAALLLVVAIVSQVEVQVPSRPVGTVEDLAALPERAGEEGDLNVIFILVDTLRADHLSTYGYERETSPILSTLASQGIRFERVIAQSSWTKSSMASLWTGTYPANNGILRWNHVVPDDALMPAEVFKKNGYRTAGIYRNGWVSPKFGFNQGFDNYFIPTPSRTQGKFEKRNPSSSPLQGTDEDVTDGAKAFLQSFKNERFFLYLHYMDVHQYAFDEASALFGTDYEGSYDNAIRWVDRNLGALFKELEELGLFEKTLVVITSDHGEGFREHGLEGHARTLYSEVTHVPWIIIPPFRLEEPIVVQENVANIDVLPTLYDMLGFDPLPGADGVSAFPAIEAAARGTAVESSADRPLFAHLDRHWGKPDTPESVLVSITMGDDRLISKRGVRMGSEPPEGVEVDLDNIPLAHRPSVPRELFDLSVDPQEAENLAVIRAERVERLQAEVEAYLATDTPSFGAPGSLKLEEMDLQQLKALGYVIQ